MVLADVQVALKKKTVISREFRTLKGIYGI